jgi:DNA-binding beta-propeller fold protein YncE
VITRYFLELPSYTIQTSGKLYIINEVVILRSLIYSLVKKVEIPIDLESHEAAALSGQNKVVTVNYLDRGNRIKVINTKTNKVEKTIDLNIKFKRYRRSS